MTLIRNLDIISERAVKLIYKNKIVKLEHDKKIKIGNVRFTYEGFLLYGIVKRDGIK